MPTTTNDVSEMQEISVRLRRTILQTMQGENLRLKLGTRFIKYGLLEVIVDDFDKKRLMNYDRFGAVGCRQSRMFTISKQFPADLLWNPVNAS